MIHQPCRSLSFHLSWSRHGRVPFHWPLFLPNYVLGECNETKPPAEAALGSSEVSIKTVVEQIVMDL